MLPLNPQYNSDVISERFQEAPMPPRDASLGRLGTSLIAVVFPVCFGPDPELAGFIFLINMKMMKNRFLFPKNVRKKNQSFLKFSYQQYFIILRSFWASWGTY